MDCFLLLKKTSLIANLIRRFHMYKYCNAVRHLSNSSVKELNKKFTNNIAHEIWHDDGMTCYGPCCCDMYDDDHLSDEYYEWEYEYMEKRTHLFYENIFKLKDVFTHDFLEKVKAERSAEIDSLNVYLKINATDLFDGYNSKFFSDFFDEGNKYNLDLYCTINYRDFDLTRIRNVGISIMDPFEAIETKGYKNHYRSMYQFNINYEKHMQIDFSKISFFNKRRERSNIPDWCETTEEALMYMYLDKPQYKKLKEIFDIKEVIKDLNVFELAKMYMF